MCTTPRNASFGFTEQPFPPGGHVCHIYTDEAERRRFVARFIESGLASGEKVIYLADESRDEKALPAFLSELGVHPDSPPKPGQFYLAEAEKSYCPDGRFSPERMLDTWHTLFHRSLAEHFRGVRATGETAWLRKGLPGLERWFEYEARLNLAIAECPYTGILCQYDAHRLDGTAMYEVLSVHPMVIVRGQIVHNPYYEPPEQYLARYRPPAS